MAIDIGPGAIERLSTITSGYTFIDLGNPANATGDITSVEIWANTNLTGMRVGTFFLVSGTTYQCRASATIGSITAGSLQTFTVDSGGNPLAIAVQAGDYIGCYYSAGTIERDTAGYVGIRYVSGEYIDSGDQASYALFADDAISLYGSGTEAGAAVGHPCTQIA